MGSLTRLAYQNLAQAKLLDDYLASKDLPIQSFDHDSLRDLPPDMVDVRDTLVNSAHTLTQLAQEATWMTSRIMINVSDGAFHNVSYKQTNIISGPISLLSG